MTAPDDLVLGCWFHEDGTVEECRLQTERDWWMFGGRLDADATFDAVFDFNKRRAQLTICEASEDRRHTFDVPTNLFDAVEAMRDIEEDFTILVLLLRHVDRDDLADRLLKDRPR